VRAAAFGAPIGGNGNNSGAQWRTLGPFANQSSAYPHPLGPAQIKTPTLINRQLSG